MAMLFVSDDEGGVCSDLLRCRAAVTDGDESGSIDDVARSIYPVLPRQYCQRKAGDEEPEVQMMH